MNNMLKKMFRHYDYTLIVPVLLLCGFGLLMVYSSSIVVALHDDKPADFFFTHQLMNLVAALIAFFVAMLFPYKAYERFTKLILGISLASLVAVFIIGRASHGAQSWITIAGFNFQPSEFVKIGLIIYLAAVFSKKQNYISNFSRSVVPPLIVIVVTFMLIVAQPDLGTGMIVVAVAGVMIICSGMRGKHLFGLLSLGGIFAVIGLSVFFMFGSSLMPEQYSRIGAAYAPFDHPAGGYQLRNSYIAIASGGLTGRGLGESIQKYRFLPEPYTDFIMAIVAEEFGLVGVILVIGLLAYLVFRGFMTGIRCKDTFGSLLAIGITGMLGVQSVINLGVVCGFVPVTGVPLPFISYGGSALVLFMFSMGILVNISMFVSWKSKKAPEQEMDIPQSPFHQQNYVQK